MIRNSRQLDCKLSYWNQKKWFAKWSSFLHVGFIANGEKTGVSNTLQKFVLEPGRVTSFREDHWDLEMIEKDLKKMTKHFSENTLFAVTNTSDSNSPFYGSYNFFNTSTKVRNYHDPQTSQKSNIIL
jgi:hypothetical protein